MSLGSRERCEGCARCAVPPSTTNPRKAKTMSVDLDTQERFWSKVDKGGSGGCWEWVGSRSPTGYGRFYFNGVNERAHRVSALYAGHDISGRMVCHRCDNPGCVRPSHLFVGTHNDNMKDKVAKGRQSRNRGPKNGRAHLTRKQVLEARRIYRSGECSQAELARRWGVPRSTIGHAIRGYTWSQL